jgi:hypothetical protein
MKFFLPLLLLFISSNLFAIKLKPAISKQLVCTNAKKNKTFAIKTNSKITIWHLHQTGIIKTSGTLTFVDDSIVNVLKNGSYQTIKIPIHNIQAVRNRNNAKLIVASAAFIPSSVLSVFTIQLLNRVSSNRTTPSGIPNRANGMAGVVGLVIGIIIFPITIISGVIATKQLTRNKMSLGNGWIFTAK